MNVAGIAGSVTQLHPRLARSSYPARHYLPMRAYVVNSHAHHSKLPLTADAPEPKPGKGEVLVEIYSAALNFFDILQAQGKHQSQPKMPFVLGSEFAGRIARESPIPMGCPFQPGDRVFGAAQGAFAERVAVSWKKILPTPSNMSMDQAAGLMVTWPTSYEALVGRAQLKPGEWVLVTAGAGGVGLSAVQIAKAMGAKVIATAGTPAKLEICRTEGGADYVLDYTKEGWQNEVKKITGEMGVDIVYDPVGRIRESLKCIAWKGRAIVVGFAGGEIEKLPLNVVLLKNISIVGIHWGAYSHNEPEYIPSVWKGLLTMLESGKVRPNVFEQVWDLEDLAKGLDALEKRRTWGKAIVRVRKDEERARL